MMSIETMNEWAESWCIVMGYGILDSVFVFCVVGSIWLLIRKRASVQFGYCLFLLVLLNLIVPSPISLPSLFLDYSQKPFELEPGEPIIGKWYFGSSTGPRQVDESAGPYSVDVPIPNDGLGFSLSFYLMMCLVMISLTFLLRLGWVNWKTRFMIENTIPLNPILVPVNLEQLQLSAGFNRKIRWVTGDWVKSPMAFGFLHPVIAVPKDMKQNFTPNQIRWILLHELAHIRRGDSVVAAYQKVVLAVFFFNPLVWWTNCIVNRMREYACDDAALVDSQSPRKECGEGFLGVVMQINNLPTFALLSHGMIDYETMIYKRLMRILNNKRVVRNKLSRKAGWIVLAIALVLLPCGMTIAYAQIARWTLIPTSHDELNLPEHRAAAVMVYDSARDVIVYCGGMILGGVIPPETWEFVNQSWNVVYEDGPKRCAAGMAFDPIRQVSVLYGGYNIAINFDLNSYGPTTMLWDGTNWTKGSVEGDEPPRAGAPLIYFPPLHGVIRHGGIDGDPTDPKTAYFNDTCLWDGHQWIKIAEGPTRGAHKMVYDPIRKKVVLWGGTESRTSYPEDTWEFDGVKWDQVATVGPHGRHWHGFAFDEKRGVTVMYGGSRWVGFETNNYWMGDIWEWDGKAWTEIKVPNPGTASSPDMVYDPLREKLVVYIPSGRGRGRNMDYGDDPTVEEIQETWEYGLTAPSGLAWKFWKTN